MDFFVSRTIQYLLINSHMRVTRESGSGHMIMKHLDSAKLIVFMTIGVAHHFTCLK